MKKLLIDEIPLNFKNAFPANAFFVAKSEIKAFRNHDLKFAKSNFYNTDKMSCYKLYKPAFLRP